MLIENIPPLVSAYLMMPRGRTLSLPWLSRGPRVGDVIQDGAEKRWLFCKTKDGEPFLVEPQDSGVMRWRKAMAFATFVNASLPSRQQLLGMYHVTSKGALKNTFNTAGADDACWYWSSSNRDDGSWLENPSEFKRSMAHKIDMSNGTQFVGVQSGLCRVRLVRPYSIT